MRVRKSKYRDHLKEFGKILFLGVALVAEGIFKLVTTLLLIVSVVIYVFGILSPILLLAPALANPLYVWSWFSLSMFITILGVGTAARNKELYEEHMEDERRRSY